MTVQDLLLVEGVGEKKFYSLRKFSNYLKLLIINTGPQFCFPVMLHLAYMM
jgi:hypothetical protein